MRAPVGPEAPAFLGLAAGRRARKLDLVEAAAAQHGVLIGDEVARRAQAAPVAREAELARKGKAAAIGEARKGDADEPDRAEARGELGDIGLGAEIERRAVLARDLAGIAREAMGPVLGVKAAVSDQSAHAGTPSRVMRPSGLM